VFFRNNDDKIIIKRQATNVIFLPDVQTKIQKTMKGADVSTLLQVNYIQQSIGVLEVKKFIRFQDELFRNFREP